MAGELVTKGGATIRKGRISPALMTAIKLIVEQGLSQADAAQRVGMKPVSLSIALHKPHVKAMRAAVKRAWLDSKTDKAWQIMADLAENAASEDVRHKSAKVFLDAAGELSGNGNDAGNGPRTLVQIVMHHPGATGQPLGGRLPGVIENQAPQHVPVIPSNLIPVGRGSTVADDAE